MYTDSFQMLSIISSNDISQIEYAMLIHPDAYKSNDWCAFMCTKL